jgi:hypothetical protein
MLGGSKIISFLLFLENNNQTLVGGRLLSVVNKKEMENGKEKRGKDK